MTTATRKPKQTAGNNPLLKAVRRQMNDPIYKRFAATYNAEGEQAALDYLQTHFRRNVREWMESIGK